jgi:hypothetical protein
VTDINCLVTVGVHVFAQFAGLVAAVMAAIFSKETVANWRE